MIIPAHSEHFEQTLLPPFSDLRLDLSGFTYDDRRLILPALLKAMSSCGGWMLDRQPIRGARTEFWFEVQLRSAIDLYSELMRAGLELTRPSHLSLTSLCMLRLHNVRPTHIDPVVTVRLEVSFLEEDEEESLPEMAATAAMA